MAAAAPCAAPQSQRYQRRRPEQTLWYRTVQAHFATWLKRSSGAYGESPPAYVERSFAAISTAAFSPMALPTPGVTPVSTIS